VPPSKPPASPLLRRSALPRSRPFGEVSVRVVGTMQPGRKMAREPAARVAAGNSVRYPGLRFSADGYVDCPMQGCRAVMRPDSLPWHCELYKHSIPNAEVTGSLALLAEDTAPVYPGLQLCPGNKVRCPKQGCGKVMGRVGMLDHCRRGHADHPLGAGLIEALERLRLDTKRDTYRRLRARGVYHAGEEGGTAAREGGGGRSGSTADAGLGRGHEEQDTGVEREPSPAPERWAGAGVRQQHRRKRSFLRCTEDVPFSITAAEPSSTSMDEDSSDTLPASGSGHTGSGAPAAAAEEGESTARRRMRTAPRFPGRGETAELEGSRPLRGEGGEWECPVPGCGLTCDFTKLPLHVYSEDCVAQSTVRDEDAREFVERVVHAAYAKRFESA
jgi:hypothetical protein